MITAPPVHDEQNGDDSGEEGQLRRKTDQSADWRTRPAGCLPRSKKNPHRGNNQPRLQPALQRHAQKSQEHEGLKHEARDVETAADVDRPGGKIVEKLVEPERCVQRGDEKQQKDPEILALLALRREERQGDDAQTQSGELVKPPQKILANGREPGMIAERGLLANGEVVGIKAREGTDPLIAGNVQAHGDDDGA